MLYIYCYAGSKEYNLRQCKALKERTGDNSTKAFSALRRISPFYKRTGAKESKSFHSYPG